MDRTKFPHARVLIVDDDAESLEALRELLALSLPDVEVRTEPDPRKALEIVRQTHPDLVIADYRMSPMNGLDFLQRSREIAPKAKRVLASAYPGEIVEKDGLDLVLVKPLHTAPFVERVRALLGLPPHVN